MNKHFSSSSTNFFLIASIHLLGTVTGLFFIVFPPAGIGIISVVCLLILGAFLLSKKDIVSVELNVDEEFQGMFKAVVFSLILMFLFIFSFGLVLGIGIANVLR